MSSIYRCRKTSNPSLQAPCYNENMEYKNPDKLWSKVDQSGGSDTCWPWTGYRTVKGYGRLYFHGRERPNYAHRIAWELTNGPIPTGQHICHHCDNPPCCNPKHLFLGDAHANAHDALRKGVLFGARGEAHSSAKITELQVRETRRRFPVRGRWTGGSTREQRRAFADELGVPLTTLEAVIYHQTWKHIQ